MEKRLYRSKSNRVLAGVCGGIAEYFNIDPTIVRIIWVVIGLTYGAGIIAYIIASIIIPDRKFDSSYNAWNEQSKNEDFEPGFNPNDWKQEPKHDTEKSRNTVGIILIAIGLIFLARQLFNWLDLKVILPLIFIIAGAFLIFNSRRNPQ
ncbi:MAG TPA: PspC domain-containing protein [Clostridiaceae bacterium]|nr:PspC domain-containing protein [Clostridiaceae bacterium]